MPRKLLGQKKGDLVMKKRLLCIIVGCMFSLSLVACGGGSSESMTYDSAIEEAAPYDDYYGAEMNSYGSEDGMYEEKSSTENTENTAVSKRKLIKTVELDVETKDYDGMVVNLETQITELGGYIESLNCYGSEYRHASITARIPVAKLDGFVKQIGETSNVTRRSESVEDVTLQYVDLDSHTRMLEEEQERLLELLETAYSIEDMITIESRLGEVRYQLESMKSQLRTFDNQVDYSTVHIDIEEVIELTPVVELSDGERIVQGFAKSVADVCHGIKEFFIELIINIPYILVWAVLIGIVIVIIRIIIKISDKHSAKILKERQEKMNAGVYASPFVNRPSVATDNKNEEHVTSDKTE